MGKTDMHERASPAKLNLFLEVVGKRPDGFHDIESVFVEIGLADTLSAALADAETSTLVCDDPEVPTDGRNLILRAAELLRNECGLYGKSAGIHFRLEKRIPMGGGLGGGSSNAAAALRLANDLWRAGLSDADLAELGARLGSDVPFFLHGGTCLCEGRGERITPLPQLPTAFALGLVISGIHSDTASAYRSLRLPSTNGRRGADAFIRAMERADTAAMAREAFNRFEETVFAALPELRAIHREAERTLRRPVRMSGSGSGLWFFREREEITPEQSALPDSGAQCIPV